jgi:hypothetical protein
MIDGPLVDRFDLLGDLRQGLGVFLSRRHRWFCLSL